MAQLVVAESALDAELDKSLDARIVVATDFSEAALALTILRAFAAILGRNARAVVVLAVPTEPGDEEANSAQMLLAEAGHNYAGQVRLESFEQAARLDYDAAVVPRGDLATVLAEVGDAIVRMHQLAAPARGEVNQRPAVTLQRRLAAFCEIDAD